jgi:hypothetical protein
MQKRRFLNPSDQATIDSAGPIECNGDSGVRNVKKPSPHEENDVASVRSVLALVQTGPVRDAGTGAFGAECYHGGFLRLAIGEIGLVERRVLQDAERIQLYRNQLIANPADEVPGLFDQSGDLLLAPVNALGQTPSQTTREHLNTLYLNRNAAAGGFFPNGLNGAIR